MDQKGDYKKFLGPALLIILLALSVLRVLLIINSPVNLSGDEAQYWDWSRRLDFGYYSKPPGIAWLIWSSTELLGDTEIGVRAWPVIFSALSSLMLFKLGRELYGEKAGFAAALLLQIIPVFTFYGMGMTPDSPLIFFFTAGLLLLHFAVKTGRLKYWLGLGVCLGAAMLCKYAIIFFIVCMLIYLGVDRQRRKYYRQPGVWLTLLITLAFMTPVIYWNAAHEWVNFRHDLGHTKVAEGFVFKPNLMLEFVGGQIGIISPILFFMLITAVIKRRKICPLAFWFCVPMLAGFFIKSIQGRVQPNWAITAYIAPLAVLADMYFARWRSLKTSTKALTVAGAGLAIFMSVFVYMPTLASKLGAPPEYDPSTQLRGWDEIGGKVSDLQDNMGQGTFIFTDYYMRTALLAFYCDGQPRVYYYNPGFRRMNQYDLWPGFEGLTGRDAIFLTDYGELHKELEEAFDSYEKLPVEIENSRGVVINTLYLYVCRDFKGMEKSKVDKY